ncbi:MAG: hypothetical protein ACRDOL_22600 [Streptosporangiaceae bacterium]
MFDSEWLAREIAEANQRISDVCRASESARTERNERARRTAIDALTDRVLGDKDLTRAIVAEYVGRELKFI